jgi:hypothetical protein
MTTTWEKIGTKNLVCVEKFPTVDANTQALLLITQHLQSNSSTCLSPSPSLLPSLPSLPPPPPPPPFYFAPLSVRSSSLSPSVALKVYLRILGLFLIILIILIILNAYALQ